MNNPIKILAFFVLLLIGHEITNAQQADIPTSWIAGGSLSFYSQLNDSPVPIFGSSTGLPFINFSGREDTRNTSFRFTPYVGKEISRHWTLGLQLQYGMDRYVSRDVITIPIGGQLPDTLDLRRNENQYGISLFGRYVFNPDQKFMVFLQPYVGYAFGDRVNLQDELENYRVETTALVAGASLGVLYELSERFRLTSRMGLIGFTAGHSLEPISGDESDFNSFSTTLNLSSLFFGFEFKF